MLEKIVSGGQTGADIAALMAAHDFGITTGGWMPKGFITQGGPRPEYKIKYNLVEHSSSKYAPRTYANVKDSDATLRFAYDFNSPGEICTMKAIHEYKKPFMDVDVKNPRRVEEVMEWLLRHQIKILNVAGNSERTYHGMTGEVYEYMSKLFGKMGFQEKGNK